MKGHDALCPTPNPQLIDRKHCAYCNLIKRVRDHYREKYAERDEDKPITCPACLGKGSVPSWPHGEPDGCFRCWGAGQLPLATYKAQQPVVDGWHQEWEADMSDD